MILLDPLARPVIGHRGNRAHSPEETLASLREAVALGVDGVEFDLHVSSDGHLVLMHDPTLDRTTPERGAVKQRTLAELQQIDAGYSFSKDGGRTFPWRGRGATIVSFDEIVETLPRDLPFIIELKTAEASEPLRAAIRRHAIARKVIVASFSEEATLPLRGEGFALGASKADGVRALPSVLLRRKLHPTFDAMCIPPFYRGIPVPIGGFVRSLRGTNVVVHVWTINDPRRALRLWEKGVNGIISDDPAAILAARR